MVICKWNLLFLTVAFACTLTAAPLRRNAAYEAYIAKYQDIAIEQMNKYHIPASITLAQGLLESGAGQSELTKRSNNHFGIKCHSDWKGKRTYQDDDNRNDCFRVYSSARDSYEDHSRFLLKPRYSRLFKLDQRDYKGWARGLKACGYATLRTYADRLIGIIELYELYKLDKKGGGKSYIAIGDQHPLHLINNLDCVIARDGDSWDGISKELKQRGIKVSARKLRKYNEAPSKYFFPSAGTPIFLQKKLRHADKNTYPKDYWHHVKAGESMYSIAQQYGVRISNLYKMNYRRADYVPEEGDLLKVR
mgnify:CR=1 FL=1